MNEIFIFKRFGLCPQEENGIEDIKTAKNANSDDIEDETDFMEQVGFKERNNEVLENSIRYEETQENNTENPSDGDKTSDSSVTIDNEYVNTDALQNPATGAKSVDAIVEQYKNNNTTGDFSVASDNDLIVAQKNCNDEANGGKHQFYCQEIPTQAQLAESSPLNSKLKYRGHTDQSKEGYFQFNLYGKPSTILHFQV